MSCGDYQNLLGLAPHELSDAERNRFAAHLETCATCLAQHKQALAIDGMLADATAGIPLRGAELAAATMRAPRTRLLVRLARWGVGMYRMGLVAAPPVISVALLVLGLWLANNLRPRSDAQSSASSLPRPGQLGQDASARVWLVRSVPQPDVPLQGVVPFEVHAGYQLYATQAALLSVRVVDVPSGRTRYFSPPQLVTAAEQRAVISFNFDTERARELFGAGPVQLEAVLRDASPGAQHTVLASEIFGATRYTIR